MTAGLGLLLAVIGLLVEGPAPAPAPPARHLYALPVAAAALRFGRAGGGLAAVAALMLQAPRVFVHVERFGLSAAVVEELVSLLLLLGLGPLVGGLVTEARRQRARRETLQAVQAGLADEAPLERALARLRAVLAARLGAELALVLDDDGQPVLAGAPVPAPGSPAARALATGAPVFVADLGGEDRPRRALAAPLAARGRTIGVLIVERAGDLPRALRGELAALAVSVGLALDDARLAARQRRFAEELEGRVAEATARLEAMDRARSALVALASHDLRTPLTALLGFSELLAGRRFRPEEVGRMAAIIHRETERLGRLVDDFLDLSRLERGLGLRLHPVAVEVGPVLEAAAELFQRGTATHRMEVVCPPGLPAVRADRDALDRVVRNLVSNAVKYSPRDSLVTLAARPAGEFVEVAVADRGRGIPPELLPRIFEPYFRAPEAAAAARGAGLGLAVVKALVEAQGGAVRVESAPDRGTRVTLALPACLDLPGGGE